MKKSVKYWAKLKLWFFTLFYHTSFSKDYIMDTLMEPLFWFIDHFMVFLGRMFFGIVLVAVLSIAAIAHLLGLPFWLNKSRGFTIFLIILGYWILINLLYNIIKAAAVSPGIPNDYDLLPSSGVTLCKKCIHPKPPRTHHCSVCSVCYLKFDHHCPWVNNCIGHFNHRYFILSMAYIVLGCVFIMLFGVEIGFRQIILDDDVIPFEKYAVKIENDENDEFNDPRLDGVKKLNYQLKKYIGFNILGLKDPPEIKAASKNSIDSTTENFVEKAMLFFDIPIERNVLVVIIYYAGLLCIGASIALGGLLIWHGRLISNGETSVEYHLNKAERKKIGIAFVNPYDLGRRKNWEMFFGLDQDGITFCKNILLPSSHKPTGNGYDWSFLYNYQKSN